MEINIPQTELVDFLIEAKHATYASGGSSSPTIVAPLLKGAHQLEFRSGDLLYRDIYFGQAFFVGQEIVYHRGEAIWSMCYAGGWTENLTEPEEAGALGGFLQSALRHIPKEYPFRGPLEHVEAAYTYTNKPSGDAKRFAGIEYIKRGGTILYELNYCGGCIS